MTDEQGGSRFACRAHGCPMPGGIFLGGGNIGICSYHYGVLPADWSRITQALKDWKCVSDEALLCRRVLIAPETMTDAKAQNQHLAGAWTRLRSELLGGPWLQELQPRPREQYDSWGRRLESFLVARVLHATRGVPA
jgi:hypothetical protein